MENNQTIEALLGEIKALKETVVEISANLATLVKITEEREKRFAARGERPQGDRGSDRGGFRPRSDRSESSWGNNTGGFGGRGRDDRNRNKG